MKRALDGSGARVTSLWGSTLRHPEDLPFRLQGMPLTFAPFRRQVERSRVRQQTRIPAKLRGLPANSGLAPGDIPSLKDLGFPNEPALPPNGTPRGGEAEGLRRLTAVLGSSSGKGSGPGASPAPGAGGQLAPYLAMGCISPRKVYEEARKATKSRAAPRTAGAPQHPGHYLLADLEYRDFLRLLSRRAATNQKAGAASTHAVTPMAAPALVAA